MPHFDPAVHRTSDVVRQAIIPASARHNFEHPCALAKAMMHGVPCLPEKMVTHNWGNLFSHLVAAIVADALGMPFFAGGERNVLAELSNPFGLLVLREELALRGKLQSTYWVCSFSVDQHKTICGANPCFDEDPMLRRVHPVCPCSQQPTFSGTQCEVNKFDDMMCYLAAKVHSFSQVIAVDQEFDIFTRAWCIAEINLAHIKGIKQVVMVMSDQSIATNKTKISEVDVQHMKSSRLEDKDAILSNIPDKALFNGYLRDLMLNPITGLMNAQRDNACQASMLGKVARWAFSNTCDSEHNS
jgi:hypothetical protein